MTTSCYEDLLYFTATQGFLGLFTVLLFGAVAIWLKTIFSKERFYHSFLSTLPFKKTLRLRLLFLPSFLFWAAISGIILALFDPHTLKPKSGEENLFRPSEGRLLLLAVDQSGSMKGPLSKRGIAEKSKLELVKETLKNFVQDRSGDLLSLMAFARSAEILVPPTQDQGALFEEIGKIEPVNGPEMDGTAIGYAIYKGTSLLATLQEEMKKRDPPPYTIEGSALILFTDGLQDPNPLDRDNPKRSMELDQAAEFAKKWGIVLYIVNVDPSLAESRFDPNIKQLKLAAESTEGVFFLLSSADDLAEIMKKIDRLQKSRWQEPLSPDDYPSYFEKVSYRPYLLWGALSLLAGFWLSALFGLARPRFQFGGSLV